MALWLFRRLVKVGIALVLFAAVVGVATAAAWSFGVRDLATTASELDEVDLAIGSAAVTRAAVAQAVVFAVDSSNGTATEDALAAALGEASANLGAYDQLRDTVLRQDSAPPTAQLVGLSTQGHAVLELLSRGEVEPARSLVEGEFEVQYQVAVGALSAARADLVSTVASARSLTANTATAIRLSVTLGLPLLLLLVAWMGHRRRMTRLRRSNNAEVESATSRSRRLEQILSALSYRIRTPLTSIYGLSDILVQTKRIQGLDRELVTLINSEAADLHRVVEDLLTATQLESSALTLRTSIVSLQDVVEEAVKPARSAGTDVAVDCPEIWVLSDGPKLLQILRNLISNAVQHGAEPISVAVVESEGMVQCLVSDHGPGLPDAQMSGDAGAGRGLDVAFGLAELIGATLEPSRSGKVTTFTLSWSDDGTRDAPMSESQEEPQTIEGAPQALAEHAATGQAP